MELAYGGLHQLCAPFLDGLDRLPEPQRDALGTAFGLSAVRSRTGSWSGSPSSTCSPTPPTSGRWSAWSTMRSGWTAPRPRRSPSSGAGCSRSTSPWCIAVREPVEETEFGSLPQLAIGGLTAEDAGELLDSVIGGPVDRRVRDRILAEASGNPLAVLELPRAWTTAELADVLARRDAVPLAGRLEEAFLRRLEALPPDSRRLLVTAAAEPLGDATILWRAAGLLGLGPDAAAPAEEAGLIEFRDRIRFRHPLVRAAAYRTASSTERQEVHRALAEATDPGTDPDRRAWHRVADDARARRGDRRRAGAIRRAGEGARRVRRRLCDARASRPPHAGSDPAGRSGARGRLGEAGCRPTRRRTRAPGRGGRRPAGCVARRRGRAPARSGRIRPAARNGRRQAAAEECAAHGAVDAVASRETYLDALVAAIWASGADASDVVALAAASARSAPPAPRPARVIDVVLDALATRLTDGYLAAGPLLASALDAVRALEPGAETSVGCSDSAAAGSAPSSRPSSGTSAPHGSSRSARSVWLETPARSSSCSSRSTSSRRARSSPGTSLLRPASSRRLERPPRRSASARSATRRCCSRPTAARSRSRRS